MRFLSLAFLLILAAGTAQASLLINNLGTGTEAATTAYMANVFVVGPADITVGGLGLADYGAAGFTGTHTVHLTAWSTSLVRPSGPDLAAVTIGPGDTLTYESGYAFETFAPVTLSANTRYAVWVTPMTTAKGDFKRNILSGAASPDPGIASLSGYYHSGTTPLTSGWLGAGGGVQAYSGPNVLIPEPATLAVLAMGGLGLLMRRRNR